MITDADVKKISKVFATKDDLKGFATKDDLKNFATKDDLKGFATKDDLKNFATKDDLKSFAKKDDLSDLEESMNQKLEKIYNLLDRILGNQEDFKIDFVLLNDQVQRHEKILQGMA